MVQFLNNKVYKMVVLVYSKTKNQSFLLESVVYSVSNIEKYYLHSLDIMSIISTPDDSSDRNSYFFTKTVFNDETYKPYTARVNTPVDDPYTFHEASEWTNEFNNIRENYINNAANFQLYNQLE